MPFIAAKTTTSKSLAALSLSVLIGAGGATVSAPAATDIRVDLGSVSLLASEALIMTGTAMPVVTPSWMDFVSRNFIAPTAGAGYVNTPVTLPVQLWPVTGFDSLTYNESTRTGLAILDAAVKETIARNTAGGTPNDPLVLFGYSQSGHITGMAKQVLLGEAANGVDLPPIQMVMMANPTRPSGGLFSRFFGLGLGNWNPMMAPPSNTPFPSFDIAHQYDFFADFPTYPLNSLAMLNTVFGLMNHNYSQTTLNPADPNYNPDTVVQTYGDTTYYLIPSKLPLLEPLRMIGLAPVADFLDPILKVFVELGYDRTSYGQFLPAQFFSIAPLNVEKFFNDLGAAVQQGFEALTSAAPETAPPAETAAPRSEQSAPSRAAAVASPSPAPAPTAASRRTARAVSPVSRTTEPLRSSDAAPAAPAAASSTESSRTPNRPSREHQGLSRRAAARTAQTR